MVSGAPFIYLALLLLAAPLRAAGHRGARFIGFSQFESFAATAREDQVVLTSPELRPEIAWNELVISWNVRHPESSGVTAEARVIYPGHETAWYVLGRWSGNPERFARESLPGQRDGDGAVYTDTLCTKQQGGAVQLRLTLLGGTNLEELKFVGVSFADTQAAVAPLPPEKIAWGKVLPVPERSQADYPDGITAWCSPTAVSMILAYWSARLGRPDLDHSVPEVARAVDDPKWPGTGNWPFNMAFAGSHPGLRAYVTRFSDVRELEEWVAAGIPVGISVSYGWLKGHEDPGNGHLVVCAGFTEAGDLVTNDPGRKQVRQVYARGDLVKAWRKSHNTVYLIYPEDQPAPRDAFGHWFNP